MESETKEYVRAFLGTAMAVELRVLAYLIDSQRALIRGDTETAERFVEMARDALVDIDE